MRGLEVSERPGHGLVPDILRLRLAEPAHCHRLWSQRLMSQNSTAPADGWLGWNDSAHRDRRTIGFEAQIVFLAAPVGRGTDHAGDMASGKIAELHAPARRPHHRRHRK